MARVLVVSDDALLFDRIGADGQAIHASTEIVTALPSGGVALARTENGEIQVVRLAPTVWGRAVPPRGRPAAGLRVRPAGRGSRRSQRRAMGVMCR